MRLAGSLFQPLSPHSQSCHSVGFRIQTHLSRVVRWHQIFSLPLHTQVLLCLPAQLISLLRIASSPPYSAHEAAVGPMCPPCVSMWSCWLCCCTSTSVSLASQLPPAPPYPVYSFPSALLSLPAVPTRQGTGPQNMLAVSACPMSLWVFWWHSLISRFIVHCCPFSWSHKPHGAPHSPLRPW